MPDHRKSSTQWTLPELIDLEAQCWLDRELDPAVLERRDRDVFRRSGLDPATDVSILLSHWRNEMQQTRPIEPSPGRSFQRASAVLTSLLCLVAMSAGVSATLWALRYDGTVPVNVSVFLGLLIAPQLLLLLGYLPLVVLGWVRSSLFARLYQLPSMWMQSLLGWLWSHPWLRERSSAQGRDRATILYTGLQSLVQRHGSLVANRLFRMFQLSGVVFNLAVLACMMLLLLFTDRAFGWQSSLVHSPEQVQTVVKVLSVPWSGWLGDAAPYPSLEQIMGSRIVLRESGAMLESTDLLAWWPFLLACVLVYGLVPRLLAWLLARWNESRMLANLKFDRFEEASIVERMKSVDWNLHGRASQRRDFDEDSPAGTEASEAFAVKGQQRVVVLRDTVERYGEPMLREALTAQWALQDPQLQVLDRLADVHPSSSTENAPVLLVLEGWQPPIQERLNELASLAQQLRDAEQSLIILLLGKPAKEAVRPLAASMRTVWQQKLRLLSLANLRLAPNPQPEPMS